MRKATVLFCLAVLVALATPAAFAGGLEADLEQMMSWFEGRFDNHWQARSDEADDVEEPHGRIHSIFARVEMPQVGEHVFYVQQYADNDPARIYRQRIYRFDTDEQEEAVRLVIFAPPDPKAVIDAHLDPSKVTALDAASLKSYPGCEVYWKRQEDHFIGYTKEGACRVVSSRSGRTLVISDNLRLDDSSIWIQDRAEDTEGNWIYGHKGGVPHKLGRVRPFNCWGGVVKDPEAEEQEFDFWRSIELDDQGGEFTFAPEDGRPARYSVQLFQAVYKGAQPVPILELAIREQGKEKSIAYTWASPASQRIGINLRYLQVGCTRAE